MKITHLPTAVAVAALTAAPPLAAQTRQEITSPGNPIIADGSFYSADPGPVVVDGKLWIIAGRDEAAPDSNTFVMNEWQLFAASDPGSGRWQHYSNLIRPEKIFKWASPDGAWASQIVTGPDRRLYLYAPIMEDRSENENKFGVGVAVADNPLGPWTDVHHKGPIVSQDTPGSERMINIDPTVLVDDDKRVYMYWGTFGALRATELDADMVTPKGRIYDIKGARGFFEAPWLMKRKGTYYLLYAANDTARELGCTPAVYHACTAYATAPSPLGPWTYRGVLLDIVSSTTSHTGAVELNGQWWLAYHTADAKGGGHFRRSVAVDKLEWDDSVTPALIRKVVQTHRPDPAASTPTRNVAPAATAVENAPTGKQYWIAAINDGKVRDNPLPPEIWSTWGGDIKPRQWLEYRWDKPVTIDGSRIRFWNDAPPGTAGGVAPPARWWIDYWTGSAWQRVPGASGFGTETDRFVTTTFQPVTTRCLRATFDGSTDGKRYAAVAVQEWEVLAQKPVAPKLGEPRAAAPSCDGTARPLPPVKPFVGRPIASVPIVVPAVSPTSGVDDLAADLAYNPGDRAFPVATASYAMNGDPATQVNDGKISFFPSARHNRWTAYNSPNASDWVQIDMGRPQTVGRVGLYFYRDTDAVQLPARYAIDYWDGSAWRPATVMAKTTPLPVPLTLDMVAIRPVSTSRLRVTMVNPAPKKYVGLTELTLWDH